MTERLDPSDRTDHGVTEGFRRECSVRRALDVLSVKHRRIEADLQQFVQHLRLLVPGIELSPTARLNEFEILEEALARLEDEAFADLVLRVLERAYR
jgi:hypothetical protein